MSRHQHSLQHASMHEQYCDGTGPDVSLGHDRVRALDAARLSANQGSAGATRPSSGNGKLDPETSGNPIASLADALNVQNLKSVLSL